MLRKRTLKTDNLRKKKRKILFVRAGVLIAAVILFITGLAYVAEMPRFQVIKVAATGNSLVTENQLWETIENQIQGKYLFFFPKTNFLLFPKQKVLVSVANAFPVFDGAKLSIDNFNTVHITVSERKPAALWCKGSPDSPNQCYFLDIHSYIYDVAPEFKGTVYTAYFGGLDAKNNQNSNPIGQVFLTHDRFATLSKVVEGLISENLSPITVTIKQFGDYDVGLQGGGDILLNENLNPDQAIINLQTFLTQNKNDIQTKGLNYIDLRFGNKVYYKFK